jgi:LemA protein
MEVHAIFMLCTAAGFLVVAIVLFNTLIGRKNRVDFASIDAMLKKRFDLIPNLVAMAEKYMTYESGVLAELTACRAKALSGGLGDDELVALDGKVATSLRSLFAVAENYPQLRASEPFLQLQGSLNEVEEQLSASRRAYNAAVTDYNNGCEMFPLNIAARMMGYHQKMWFQIPENERQPVQVWR